MIIQVNNKTYGDIDVVIDKHIYIKKGLNKLKINVEYNKSKHGYYAYVMQYGKKVRLHRYITDCPSDLVVDHINGNTLDNRLKNLRVCTRLENNRNRMDTLLFPPTSRNNTGIRGLSLMYCERDKRHYYRFKLNGYKTKYFSLSRKDEAIEYAHNPDKKAKEKKNEN